MMLIFGYNIPLILLIVSIIFILCFLIQLFFYLIIYSRLIFYRKKDVSSNPVPVSVIICAKNESDNLKKFLPAILEQDYPEFEVIVVNHYSTDDTADVLYEMSVKYPNLRISTIPNEPILTYGKKLAQTIGIKAAKNEWLVFTDADCQVQSKKWLSQFSQNFNAQTEIVLGYGSYFKQKGIMDKIIRYETLFIALQYLTFCLAGFPYMGVGRNLAYRKSVFFRNHGFASHTNLESGDDDLFVNEVANNKNTGIEISNESHTKSVPKNNIRQWLNQKTRHITTSRLYKLKHKLLLGNEIGTRVLLYITFIFLLSYNFFPLYIVSIFMLRLIIFIIIVKISIKYLNERDLLLYSPIIDFLLPFIYLYLGIRNYIDTRRSRWK